MWKAYVLKEQKKTNDFHKTIELQTCRTHEQFDPPPIKTSFAAFIQIVIANVEQLHNSRRNLIFEVAKIFMLENLPSDPVLLAIMINYGTKEVIALPKFYKINPDPIETEALENKKRNFKFEVLQNCSHADDNCQLVLTITAKRELDWSTFSMIARAILKF